MWIMLESNKKVPELNSDVLSHSPLLYSLNLLKFKKISLS